MLIGLNDNDSNGTVGINEYTRRACDAPVNSRRPRVSGGRGSRVNSQPADVTSSPSLSTFKGRLKTELFVRSYP